MAQRLDKRSASRRRFLLAGLTVGAALAVGAGASLFRPRLFPAAPPWVRELDMDGTVNTVTWSPDGHLFAAGGATNHITVWRTSDGQELTRLAGPDSHAWTWSIAWSPHSRSVASTWNSAWSGNRVRIWNVPSDENTSLWPYERDLILQGLNPALGIENWWPMVIAWSPDGTRLAVGDSSGGLQVLNPYTRGAEPAKDCPPFARQPEGGASLADCRGLPGARSHRQASEQARSILSLSAQALGGGLSQRPATRARTASPGISRIRLAGPSSHWRLASTLAWATGAGARQETTGSSTRQAPSVTPACVLVVRHRPAAAHSRPAGAHPAHLPGQYRPPGTL